ncbi:hypothetical protein KDH_28730 [Dictyobacter sp. S3.2.2.5]|uniref:carbonic anhydrase n=1 Tax=Dictyobacter halimunensis TaxID=3026934 RepID=A0ABQ6FP24_9CHLR|nr:hypothetical protein KDH_28730 [Dictyobacter sp. S3.2.2.5]
MLCKLATRRAFLAASGLAVMGIIGLSSSPTAPTLYATPAGGGAPETSSPPTATQTVPTAQQALQQLLDGNRRFERGETAALRQAIAQKQTPLAIVFSCADSRVPPELVFDQHLGDLFTIRTAGQVIDDAALGTIEYGIAELAIPLLVVLGHERCGAVQAALEAVDHHAVAPGHIQYLVDYIRPSALKAQGQGNARLSSAIHHNIVYTVHALSSRSTIIGAAVQTGTLTIVGGDYDLDAGTVRIILSSIKR